MFGRKHGRQALVAAALTCVTVAAIPVVQAQANVLSWGRNEVGQLGVGSVTGPETCRELPCSASPRPVPGLESVKAIAEGLFHGLAVRSNGTVVAWGLNSAGQLGNGSTETSSSPVTVSGLKGVVAVAAGDVFSLALLKNGTVKAWGYNGYGQLGNGTTESALRPVTVPGLTEVVALAAGNSFALALLKTGAVLAWGNNEAGQLGIGSSVGPDACLEGRSCSTRPVSVPGLTGIVAVGAGWLHSVALTAGRGVMTWGGNRFAQLGSGEHVGPETCAPWEGACSMHPQAVEGLTGIRAISAGVVSTAALTEAGALVTWGYGRNLELGNGREYSAPAPVSSLEAPIVAFAGGGYHGTAANVAGTVRAWGRNEYGEVGDGTTYDRQTPVPVPTLAGATAFANNAFGGLAYVPPPSIGRLLPNAGGAAGGYRVVIHGKNLLGASTVWFGASAAPFEIVSRTELVATAPPEPVGTVSVSVVSNGGTSKPGKASSFTYR